MVLVAAIALASSTYAWFVSNNEVTATTSTISAQSNAPFLKIANKTKVTGESGAMFKDVAKTEDKFTQSSVKTLYPAQVVGEFVSNDAEVTDKTATVTDVKFQSAYATKATEATERDNTRFTVGNPKTAVNGNYAYMESFLIGSDDSEAGSFANLNVSGVTVTADADATWNGYTYKDEQNKDVTISDTDAKKQMIDAMRVLIVNKSTGDWTVWKNGAVVENYKNTNGDQTLSGTKKISNSNPLADTIAAGAQVEIAVYVFYDGADSKIFTNNMSGLHDVGATISFTADFINNATK